jgi:hypothetical protein
VFKKAFWIFGAIFVIGALCNFTVIAANDNKMPVLGDDGDSPKHRPLTSESRLVFLADIYEIHLPSGTYLFSIGDVLLVLGGIFAGFFLFCYFATVAVAQEALKLIDSGPSPIKFFGRRI